MFLTPSFPQPCSTRKEGWEKSPNSWSPQQQQSGDLVSDLYCWVRNWGISEEDVRKRIGGRRRERERERWHKETMVPILLVLVFMWTLLWHNNFHEATLAGFSRRWHRPSLCVRDNECSQSFRKLWHSGALCESELQMNIVCHEVFVSCMRECVWMRLKLNVSLCTSGFVHICI